jgi:hypothetical protein
VNFAISLGRGAFVSNVLSPWATVPIANSIYSPHPQLEGKFVVQSDEQIETYEFSSVPGYRHTLVWVNATTPDLRNKQRLDHYPESVVPGPGGTSLHFVTFPPGAVFAEPSFDPEAARKEALVRLRGLADHFEG